MSSGKKQVPSQESLFWSESDIYYPPFWKWNFFPLSHHVVYQLQSCPFRLNSSLSCIYFTLLLDIFPLSICFLPFTPTFSPFSLPLFIFSPKWHRLIFPPTGGEWYSPVYRPLPPPLTSFTPQLADTYTQTHRRYTHQLVFFRSPWKFIKQIRWHFSLWFSQISFFSRTFSLLLWCLYFHSLVYKKVRPKMTSCLLL